MQDPALESLGHVGMDVDVVDAEGQLSKIRYTLRDCYLSALALFFVQDASLLQFQRRFQRQACERQSARRP